MQLTVADRLALLSVLPQTGDITTLRIVRNLRENLSFSEEEHAELGLKFEGEGVRWNRDAGNPVVDVEIGEKATDVIVQALKNADREQRLVDGHIGIWERFITDE